MRLLICLALLLSLATAAAAQQQRPLDPKAGDGAPRGAPDIAGEPDAPSDAAGLMDRALPLLDGQTLRYYDGDGAFQGLARRRGLAIRFYDATGTYLGRAQRVSQRLTLYYDAEGQYVGRRIDRRLVREHEAVLGGGGG